MDSLDISSVKRRAHLKQVWLKRLFFGNSHRIENQPPINELNGEESTRSLSIAGKQIKQHFTIDLKLCKGFF